jgi:hypothetical protein
LHVVCTPNVPCLNLVEVCHRIDLCCAHYAQETRALRVQKISNFT